MFQDPTLGANAPVDSTDYLPEYAYESGRLMLFGTLGFVQMSIKELHRANYAEPNDWSRLLPTGQPNEVMSILTRRVRVD
ncbi:MAG: hypothetical protein AAGI45_23175 [Cyanobacteria bacterium P01_H01_bin.26]